MKVSDLKRFIEQYLDDDYEIVVEAHNRSEYIPCCRKITLNVDVEDNSFIIRGDW